MKKTPAIFKYLRCTPNSGHPEGGAFFLKYTLELKLEYVNKYKNGQQIELPDNCKTNRHDFLRQIRNWARLFDKFGVDGLTHNNFHRHWTPEEKFKMVAQILAGKPFLQVASENKVNEGQLYFWVTKYREKGMDGLECRRGRPTEVLNMPKKKKVKLAPSEKEDHPSNLDISRDEYNLTKVNEPLSKLDMLKMFKESASSLKDETNSVLKLIVSILIDAVRMK